MRSLYFLLLASFFLFLETDSPRAEIQRHIAKQKTTILLPPLPRFKPNLVPFTRTSGSQLKIYGIAIPLAKKGEWKKLDGIKRLTKNEHLEKVIQWLKIKHPKTRHGFESVAKFLRQNPYWPERKQLIQQAEMLLSSKQSPQIKNQWFNEYPPKTTDGHLKWINALQAMDDTESLDAAVLSLWRTKILSSRQQRLIARNYKHLITPEMIWDRLDWLLWKGYVRSSQRMYPYITQNQKYLAEARLRLRHMMGSVDPAIKKVPQELKISDGLVFERLRWRQRKGMMEKARELYWDISKEQKFPRFWWKERSRQIRYLLKQNNFDTAFLLAKSHFQKEGPNYAEAQWLAGWIGLRYVSKPKEASAYFLDMYAKVSTPLSKSRASYWAGRAFKKDNDRLTANKWFEIAAEYPTTYYGQLANKQLGKTAISLPKEPTDKSKVKGVPHIFELVNIACLLHEIGKNDLAVTFLKTASRHAESRDHVLAIIAGAYKIKKFHLAVYAARRAARKGIFVISASYPQPNLSDTSNVEKALVLSIIRQESNFDPQARSHRGALGFMQLLPQTAKSVAKTLKINFEKNKLTSDTKYNVKLGTNYLGSLIKKYDGSYPLAIAAYNAGPHNVNKWIRRMGNPSQNKKELIDWIERIPYGETRNYVQRVLENLTVYRELLGNKENH